jgi:hypothetical protein
MESRKKKDEEIVFCVWCIDSFDCSKNIKKEKIKKLHYMTVLWFWFGCCVLLLLLINSYMKAPVLATGLPF